MKYFGIATFFLSMGCFEPAKVVVGVEEGALTEEQFLVMRSYWGAQVRTQQNRFLQIKLGILDEETALQIRDAGEGGTGGRARSFRQHWDAMKFNYPADFVDYMDNVVLAPDRAMRE